MRIRDLAVVQLPALVREGLQSMMKVPSLNLQRASIMNLQRASIMRRVSAPAPRLAAVALAPTADQQGVGVEITALGLGRVTEEEGDEAERSVKVLLEVAHEPGGASPKRPVRLHLDLFGAGPPGSSRRVGSLGLLRLLSPRRAACHEAASCV